MNESGGRGKGPGKRRHTATRLLAHRLLHRAETVGGMPRTPNLKIAVRLADERLVPSAEERRAVAAEARRLCSAALVRRRAGGPLEGRLRANVRVGVREADGGARVVRIPTLIRHPDGSASVLAMKPAGEPLAAMRARRYREAGAILSSGPVRAFVLAPDGTLEEIPDGRPIRSAPSAAACPDTGCSPSARPRSGRRPR